MGCVPAQSPRNSPQLAKVLINPIAVEGADPALTERANAIRLGVVEILRNVSGVQLSDAAGPDVTPVAATGLFEDGVRHECAQADGDERLDSATHVCSLF